MRKVHYLVGLFFCAVGFFKSSAQLPTANTVLWKIEAAMPHFLYEGDHMEMAIKITNQSDSEITGQLALQLFDAATNTAVDGWFQNVFPVQYFTVASGKTETTSFPVEVPYLFKKTVLWRVAAHTKIANSNTEGILPILTTKVLVNEALPLNLNGESTQDFSFPGLLQADAATEHQALTIELFQNPIWHVVEALPYLAALQIENAEHAFMRFYAAAIAIKIREMYPRITQTIEGWQKGDTTAWHACLMKDTNLKSIIQEEAPWTLAAINETAQKQIIAAFFDTTLLPDNLNKNLDMLTKLQKESGGFSWFAGGPEDWFVTQSIVTGIEHLKKLDAITNENEDAINLVLKQALAYLDTKLAEEYNASLKNKKVSQPKQLSPLLIQYLYLRSFFADMALPQTLAPAYQFFQQQAKQHWQAESPLLQAMIALALHRTGDKKTAAVILQSLKQSAVRAKKTSGYRLHWWQNAVEEKAVLIEAFSEIIKDTGTISTLQRSLLAMKQENNWQTANATADVCYALLLHHANPADTFLPMQINTGTSTVSITQKNLDQQAGYFKKIITPPQLQSEMGNIHISSQQTDKLQSGKRLLQPVVYWQYFKDSDTKKAAPVRISKQLFVERRNNTGKVLMPVQDDVSLHVGDTVHVRVTVTSDRDLEYVQLKDRHAAALEPTTVSNRYQLQHGTGYYQTNTTAGTAYFLPLLPKGIFVIEYTLSVLHTGVFNNGMAAFECIYAPELSVHSNNLRIHVE